MVKKNLLGVVALSAALLGGAMVTPTYAAEENTVCAEGCKYTSLTDAIDKVEAGATIKLNEDVAESAIVWALKDLKIDLGGHRLVLNNGTGFAVKNGTTEFIGTGKIVQGYDGADKNSQGLLWVVGFEGSESTLTIGEGIELETAGWGIGVHGDNTDRVKVPVTVNVNGKITSTAAGAITINGLNHFNNEINIGSTAVLSGVEGGLYGAGNGTWNIAEGAKITGAGYALGIKSGTWNISGGTLIATGEDSTPTEGYSNGMKASGAAIQIESNAGYFGEITLNISGGTFVSENGFALYDYLNENNELAISDIKITGGTFESVKGMKISEELAAKDDLTGITGGTFVGGSVAEELLADGFVLNEDGTVKEEEKEEEKEEDFGVGAPKTGVLTTGETSAAQDIALTVLFGATMMAVILLGAAVKAKR